MIPHSASQGEDPGAQAGADPLSDIFFGLVAVILLILCFLLPLARQAPEPVPVPSKFTFEGSEATVILADATGLLFDPNGASRLDVPLDALYTDGRVIARMQAMKAAGAVPFVVIAQDGHESLFVFETLAAELDLPQVSHIRLPREASDCRHIQAHLRSPATGLCNFGRRWR